MENLVVEDISVKESRESMVNISQEVLRFLEPKKLGDLSQKLKNIQLWLEMHDTAQANLVEKDARYFAEKALFACIEAMGCYVALMFEQKQFSKLHVTKSMLELLKELEKPHE